MFYDHFPVPTNVQNDYLPKSNQFSPESLQEKGIYQNPNLLLVPILLPVPPCSNSDTTYPVSDYLFDHNNRHNASEFLA